MLGDRRSLNSILGADWGSLFAHSGGAQSLVLKVTGKVDLLVIQSRTSCSPKPKWEEP